jgi:hypothetical protein
MAVTVPRWRREANARTIASTTPVIRVVMSSRARSTKTAAEV